MEIGDVSDGKANGSGEESSTYPVHIEFIEFIGFIEFVGLIGRSKKKQSGAEVLKQKDEKENGGKNPHLRTELGPFIVGVNCIREALGIREAVGAPGKLKRPGAEAQELVCTV